MSFQDAYDAMLERWDVPVEQLDIRGTHVNACGPVDAPPVVLLAGHGATSPVWFAVAPRLAEGHRVYAVDLPGDAGRSTATPPRSVDDLMTWLAAVLEDLERPMLVGHSYGAWIALTYTLQNPDRVSRLALLDPTDCFTGLRLPYVARALPLLVKPSPARYKSFLRWETQGLPLDPMWVELSALATLEPTTRPVRPRRPSNLQDLTTDLVVAVAGRSKTHDPGQLAQRATTAGATVVQIDDATHHSLPALHADEVLKALSA
ncbi:alpha/beta fold hydrolase [Kribbella sp. NPDC050820]|uniref:alpha/beta fold hydrolase n=1 Tax=Kribbella sp. NPDC050820 TaxID=3155408 RepID=UPI0034089F4D